MPSKNLCHSSLRQNADTPVMQKKNLDCHFFFSLNTCSVRSIKFSIDTFQLVKTVDFVSCTRILIIQKIPKGLLIFIYVASRTHDSGFIHVRFGPSRSDSRTLLWQKRVHSKEKFVFYRSLNWIFDRSKVPKTSIDIDTFRHSNSSLAVVTSLFFSIKFSIKNFTPVEQDQMQNFFPSVGSDFWQTEYSWICY